MGQFVVQQSCAQHTVDIILVALIHCAFFSLFYLTKVLCQLQIIFTITRETTSSAHAVSCNIPMYMHMYAFPEPYSLCITAMHFNIVYCVKYMYLLQDANRSTEHLCVQEHASWYFSCQGKHSSSSPNPSMSCCTIMHVFQSSNTVACAQTKLHSG